MISRRVAAALFLASSVNHRKGVGRKEKGDILRGKKGSGVFSDELFAARGGNLVCLVCLVNLVCMVQMRGKNGDILNFEKDAPIKKPFPGA